MTQNTPPTESTAQGAKQAPFCKRLRSAREAMGLERKEAAAQLHLNEKIIIMMENDRYPADMHTIFIRGYLRSYAKFLQIPEYEIKQAIEPIKQSNEHPPSSNQAIQLNSHHYFMQIFTYLIVLTVVGLVGIWWHTHSMPPLSTFAKNALLNNLPSEQKQTITSPENENQAAQTAPEAAQPVVPTVATTPPMQATERQQQQPPVQVPFKEAITTAPQTPATTTTTQPQQTAETSTTQTNEAIQSTAPVKNQTPKIQSSEKNSDVPAYWMHRADKQKIAKNDETDDIHASDDDLDNSNNSDDNY